MRIPYVNRMYRDMAESARLGNEVQCERCGKRQAVDPAYCLGHGWPECCGETMALAPVVSRSEGET